MALRDDLLPVVDAGRELAEDLGLRQRVVKTRLRVWSGGVVGRGTATDTDTTISPAPKVREPPARFVHETAGRFQEGDLQITKISASIDDDDLTGGTLAAGREWFILVDGEPYRVVGRPEIRNFEKRLLVRKITGRVA
jgi:hypothetical protein